MPSTALYRSDLARMGNGRNSPDYHALPAYLRSLADSANSARDVYLALSEASRQARTAGDWQAIEMLDTLELLAFNTWQAIEGRGAELLTAYAAARPDLTTPALAFVAGDVARKEV